MPVVTPVIASDSQLREFTRHVVDIVLERRKGGGGRGSSGGGGGRSGGRPSPAQAKGAPSSFTKSPAARPFSVSSGGSASAYANGGGKRLTLSSGIFKGRQSGGGERKNVYGTSRYGSGYPYGVSGSYVASRPFPYVFYPIPISHYPNYYGSDEYRNISATDRPGAALKYAIIQPSSNTSSVTYRIVGDDASITATYTALITNCSIANSTSTISLFTPAPTTYPLPEQVIQWYRASTFALSLDSYNNTASSPSKMPTSNSQMAPPLSLDSPLPVGLNMTFLACLNSTIAASVPLIDPPGPKPLSNAAKGGIAIASAIGVLLLIWLLVWIRQCRRRFRDTPRKQKSILETKQGYKNVEDSESLPVNAIATESKGEGRFKSWLSRLRGAKS